MRDIRGLRISSILILIFSIIKLTFNAFHAEYLICWYGLGGLNKTLLSPSSINILQDTQ